MRNVKNILVGCAFLLFGGLAASAYTAADADTAFSAYNNAFLVGGYYAGWWTGAEEIEMAEDAYENTPSAARRSVVSNACVQFVANHGSNWTVAGPNFNNFNDDICWAVLAFTRGYLITGSSNFLNIAKSNWDAMYARAWETNFTGGGLWWNTDNNFKNAAVNGPAAIGACLLYNIYGDTAYLDKAQAIYAWERRVLLNTDTGGIADGINLGNTTTSGGATTYNQGTFIGAANLLYKITGLPFYYQDGVLVGKYTQYNMSSGAGILPEYGSGSDLSGFNGIFARWMAKFAKEQNLWPAFGPWLGTNANGAWNVRNTNNLAWQKWATPMGTNAAESWGCSASIVVMQVADASPADALVITPTSGFVSVSQRTLAPASASTSLILTNTGGLPLVWSLANTSLWLSVSATTGTLLNAGPSTNVLVSLIPSATTNLPAGRYYSTLTITNATSGVIQRRQFELVIAGGDAPLDLTGYNANIISPNTALSGAAGANAFDIPNNYNFYQAGVNAGTRGLPPDGLFKSQFDSNTVFRFGYGISNSVVLGNTYPNSTTLTLTNPRSYNSISLLACSANGGGTGTLVINFTNGTQSQVFNFNAQDWFGVTSNVAIKGFGRLKLSPFGPENNNANNPNMYQTTVNLALLGLNKPIASITFTKPAGAGGTQTTGIFSVSGSAMPDQPLFVLQPQSQTNTLPAQGVTFSPVASGAPPLSYQWYYSSNGNPGTFASLVDQTNANLQLNAVLQSTNAGSYYIVATNSSGSATSSVATLTIFREPVIVQQPTPTNIYKLVGASNTWSVIANAALPVSYAWLQDGAPVPGATSPTFARFNLQTNQSGNYTVAVSNAFGVVTSQVATLTVVPPPAYPVGQLVLAHNPVGYWRLDEFGGAVAHDLVAGNDGIFTPTVQLGQPGNKLIDTHTAAKFGALSTSNSCVTNINVSFASASSSSFSVEAWVNGSAQTSDAGIVTKGYGSGGEQFNLDCGNTASHAYRFFVRDGSGTAKLANSSVTPNGQWQHLVGVCDQTNGFVYLYVNGASVGSGTIGTNSGILNSSYTVSIGSRQSGAGTPFNFQFQGSIEEVALYKYALSPAQVQAHYVAASNRPPVFVSNPFSGPDVTAGQNLTGTVAAQATDPNGDAMTFAKVSGPAWLSVASNGTLSGTPVSVDVGTNTFVVRAIDSGSLSNSATMFINVNPAPPISAAMELQGTDVLLSWSGGIAPYEVQTTTDLAPPDWQSLGSVGVATNLVLTPSNAAAFYRVVGQ